MIIKNLLITGLSPMECHVANGGEKAFGNASTIKRLPAGNAFISGQMVRHAFFTAVDRLNKEAKSPENTYVSNGDGVTANIAQDIRADMGGYMHAGAPLPDNRRSSPLTATPAVALNPSDIYRDLKTRNLINPAESEDERNKQMIVTQEQSAGDIMLFNFSLDITMLGNRERYTYENKLHVRSSTEWYMTEDERKRRLGLAINGAHYLTDFANQARNGASGEFQKVLIVFDTVKSLKPFRYWKAGEIERQNILAEIKARGGTYFLGDDTEGGVSVYQAREKAVKFLQDNDLGNPSPLKATAAQPQPETAAAA